MNPWIKRKIYKNTDESRLLSLERNRAGYTALSFEFQGHRWRYSVTHFDDAGEYDEIERLDPAWRGQRKIVSICTAGVENRQSTQCNHITTALCEDGTLWELRDNTADPEWHQLPSIPAAPKIDGGGTE